MTPTEFAFTKENTEIIRAVQVYSGKPQKVELWVMYRHHSELYDDDEYLLLEEGKDFIVTSEEAVAPGIYFASITGLNFFSGEFEIWWELLSEDDKRIEESLWKEHIIAMQDMPRHSAKMVPCKVGTFIGDEEYIEAPPYFSYEDLLEECAERVRDPRSAYVRYSCRVFHTESAHQKHPYQDAFCPMDNQEIILRKNEFFRPAIADGVSGSYHPASFANGLVEGFCQHGFDYLVEHIGDISQAWYEKQLAEVRDAYPSCAEEMLKMEEQRLRHKTASATFAGVELREAGLSHYHAVGDCVIFVLMEDKRTKNLRILNMVPTLCAEDFNNRPPQIHSYHEWTFDDKVVQESGFCTKDTIYILATDAFACFLSDRDSDYSSSERLKDVVNLKSQEEFLAFVKKQRDAKRLRDDDTTCMVIRVM